MTHDLPPSNMIEIHTELEISSQGNEDKKEVYENTTEKNPIEKNEFKTEVA